MSLSGFKCQKNCPVILISDFLLYYMCYIIVLTCCPPSFLPVPIHMNLYKYYLYLLDDFFMGYPTITHEYALRVGF